MCKHRCEEGDHSRPEYLFSIFLPQILWFLVGHCENTTVRLLWRETPSGRLTDPTHQGSTTADCHFSPVTTVRLVVFPTFSFRTVSALCRCTCRQAFTSSCRFIHGSRDSQGIKRAAEQNQPLIGKWPIGMFLSAYSLSNLTEVQHQFSSILTARTTQIGVSQTWKRSMTHVRWNSAPSPRSHVSPLSCLQYFHKSELNPLIVCCARHCLHFAASPSAARLGPHHALQQ